MMFRGALFDMDGLLIDSERSIMSAWLSAAEQLGVAFSEHHYTAVVGRSSAESDAIMIEAFGGIDSFELARLTVEKRLIALCASTGFAVKAGVKSLLATFAERGVPCAVASSSSLAEIEERLHMAGILHFFSAVAGGDEVPRGKPDPAVYLLAAHRLGIPATECLAFEDSHFGARAALAAGARLVIIPDLLRPTAELASNCVTVLDSLEEALPFVDTWFGPRRTEWPTARDLFPSR